MGQLSLLFLVLLASVVTIPVARLTRVPQPVLMTAIGLLFAWLPQVPDITINPELILPLVLPPLIFAVARRSSVRYFRANIRSILLLAVALVIVTTTVVAGVFHWLMPTLPLAAAVALGALVSPPDPVAAVAVAGSVGLPRRLVAVLESEGLFNDVTAIVIYSVAVEAVVTGDFSGSGAALRFVLSAVVAVVVGIALGWLNAKLAGLLEDPTQQVALNLLVPFAAYVLAEEIHGSGVLAVVVCALYLADRAADADDVAYRLVGNAFWEIVEILITGVAFGLIGLELAPLMEEVRDSWHGMVGDAAWVVGALVLVRLLWLLPAAWISKRVSRADEDTPISWRETLVLWWSGMRGVATVALALGIPLTIDGGAAFPGRDEIMVVAFAVVLFTLLVQGLTLPLVVRMLGLGGAADAHEEAVKQLWWRAAKAGLTRLGELEDERDLQPEVVERLRERQHDRLARLCPERYAEEEAQEARERFVQWQAAADIEQEMIAASRREVLAARGELGGDPEIADQVMRKLDLRSRRK
ncbi:MULTISPECIES: Na+/H+ antiporter [unclassified Kitasatospora]|uniref:Na+/H+ antiporter n=1 Tax=unclassified Kitasatospora TaxID=2633591 RepID=UPI00070E55F2|nr:MULTISPECIES: Na+/H+ antiporter [unclassified Kitasatospora]KQV11783.1 sodium:proton antiporter [Kitasatospora sp. Root107]KRB76636.1 sodium:proton antiporter [Kitasatospora sp. Root187]